MPNKWGHLSGAVELHSLSKSSRFKGSLKPLQRKYNNQVKRANQDWMQHFKLKLENITNVNWKSISLNLSCFKGCGWVIYYCLHLHFVTECWSCFETIQKHINSTIKKKALSLSITSFFAPQYIKTTSTSSAAHFYNNGSPRFLEKPRVSPVVSSSLHQELFP